MHNFNLLSNMPSFLALAFLTPSNLDSKTFSVTEELQSWMLLDSCEEKYYWEIELCRTLVAEVQEFLAWQHQKFQILTSYSNFLLGPKCQIPNKTWMPYTQVHTIWQRHMQILHERIWGKIIWGNPLHLGLIKAPCEWMDWKIINEIKDETTAIISWLVA